MSPGLIALLAALALGGVAEHFFPRRAPGRAFAHRWTSNLGLALLARTSPYLIPAAWTAWLLEPRSALFDWLASGWAGAVAAVLLLDLVAYGVHRLSHAVGVLWRLHAVHHSDTEMDFTTAVRTHPLEPLTTGVIASLAAVAIGVEPWILASYGVLRTVVQCLAHANVRLPPTAETLLERVVVTPRFHRVHHSCEQPFTDSNYGELFTFWDRLFGTARSLPEERLVFGLEYFRDAASQQLPGVLAQPFRRARAVPEQTPA